MAGEFKLSDVLPWGRTRAEYTAFFALSGIAKSTRILDCAGGPASFNAEMTEDGYTITSVDPLYQFSASDISVRVAETRPQMQAGLRAARHRFVLKGPDAERRHYETRERATAGFLADFEAGRQAGRYRTATLPCLPFDSDSFDLALCSHFLFLYSDHLDTDAHIAAIAEMLRIAPEARVFPLLDLDGEPSRHVAPVRASLETRGHRITVEQVGYEFQRGGDKMMRIRRCR